MATADIGIGACTITYNGTDLGQTSGGVTAAYTADGVDFIADQYTSPIRRDITNESIAVTVPISEWVYATLALIWPQGTRTTDGSKEKIEFGGGAFDDTADYLELILDPVDDASDNLKLTVHKALPIATAEIPYSKDGYRIVAVTFAGYRDSSKASGKELFAFGDTTAT